MTALQTPAALFASVTRRGLTLAICLTLISSLSGVGNAAEPPPAQEQETPKTVLGTGVILLRSGRVIKGKISRGGGEYRIERSRGEMFLPDDLVHFVCRDLHDAYEKQRAEYKKPVAADHVSLARWCISYNLLEEARQELRAALVLEPGRVQSRSMLKRLDKAFGDTPATGSVGNEDTLGPQHDVESLGGLSEEDAEIFTSRIQPLLMNTCGNARCHAETADNKFQLVHVRTGSVASRHATQRNLAAVLKHVNFDKPSSSPILSVTEGNHGGRKIIFRGRSGRQQIQILRQWVASIANEKTNRSLTKYQTQQKLRNTLSGSSTKQAGSGSATQVASETLREIKKTVKPADAFDPGKFNAQNGQ